MLKKKIYLVILIFVLLGCEKSTDWKIKGETPNLIIVEGILTDEVKSHEIKLSFPAEELNDSTIPVSEALVILKDDDSSWTLTELPQRPGVYATKKEFSGKVGKEYTLLIKAKDFYVTSKSEMLPSSPFTSLISYTKNSHNDLYHFTRVADIFNPNEEFMWEISLDWSSVSGYNDADPEDCKMKLYYYSLSTLDITQIFSSAIEDIEFPAYTVITQKKYSLTPEFAEYLRGLLLETTWKGGLFSTASANLASNISGHGAGFFAACSVKEISITVSP
jgi:hypothetical protein